MLYFLVSSSVRFGRVMLQVELLEARIRCQRQVRSLFLSQSNMKIVHLLFLAWFTHEIEGFLLSLFKLSVVPCIFSARVPGNVFRASVYRGRDLLLLRCCSSFILLWIFLFSPLGIGDVSLSNLVCGSVVEEVPLRR